MVEEAETGASSAAHAEQAAAEIAAPGAEPALDRRELADLLAGSPDVAIADVLAVAAEISPTEKRGRGRPPGSPNRKNLDMIAYLQSRGHRDPWHTLSLIQSVGTMSLAKALGSHVYRDGKIVLVPVFDAERKPLRDDNGELLLVPAIEPADPVKVLAIQKAAAEAILPYHHAKQPQQLDLLPPGEGYKRPLMAIGELNVGHLVISGAAALSIHDPPQKIVEHQGVSEAPIVRPEQGESHDGRKPLQDKALPNKGT